MPLPASRSPLNFALILHTHLPFVLGHGRWPHGSDWLMEAAADSYLPILESLEALRRDDVAAPMTIGVTPILAAQLASSAFADELDRFLAQRLAACDDAERDMAGTDDAYLIPIVRYWRRWYAARATQFAELDRDIAGALRRLVSDGRIELMSSAATHGFLPLLARDESIRLQLLAGRDEHRRVFGHDATGCWLPECAYRPQGEWAPWPGVQSRWRPGIEVELERAGYRFVVVDAHLVKAGEPLNAYSARVAPRGIARRSPYEAYAIGYGSGAIRALVRDPASTEHVWSRHAGYPGGAHYLEFHKLRFPGGLQLWEVTASDASLGDKRPYSPDHARALAREHGAHFAATLGALSARTTTGHGGGITAPFDAELFGHWWFEGPVFLESMYRALQATPGLRPVPASTLASAADVTPIDLPAGSWGRDGDFSVWLHEGTAWTWQRLWSLEERFWDAAPAALSQESAHTVLAQAARELLLAQASDWQFMMTAGAVPDYAERRFCFHADAVDELVGALERGGDLTTATARAVELGEQDFVFPLVLAAVARAVTGAVVAA
jgi:1,4-alpha-glucan branching enzyme